MDQYFSKQLKVQKIKYLETNSFDIDIIGDFNKWLKEFNPEKITNFNHQLAFWINVYNSLTNYLIITKALRGSILPHITIFFRDKIQVGKFHLSLDDIEHGIIRQNQRAPYKPGQQFKSHDPRLPLVLNQLEPRVHFALNCGAASCPPIAAYDAIQLEEQLALATENFAKHNFLVNQNKKQIQCSIIYKYYRHEFKNTFLNDPKYKNYKIKTLKYNWQIH